MARKKQAPTRARRRGKRVRLSDPISLTVPLPTIHQPPVALPAPGPTIADLMSKPALSFEELADRIFEIPKCTLYQVIAAYGAPQSFYIGRRRYIQTGALRKWI